MKALEWNLPLLFIIEFYLLRKQNQGVLNTNCDQKMETFFAQKKNKIKNKKSSVKNLVFIDALSGKTRH